eukprot:TRINITY_DN738_c0_g2_i6.p2 TRINITY_DN738_c0_g2~~TRINITY_DN738_c0_g2_i6.p2  ORF type:complete len:106 (-),score=5.11 TRINITY_DN738_c0_g2_i6:290-607(-)
MPSLVGSEMCIRDRLIEVDVILEVYLLEVKEHDLIQVHQKKAIQLYVKFKKDQLDFFIIIVHYQKLTQLTLLRKLICYEKFNEITIEIQLKKDLKMQEEKIKELQ